MTLYHATTAARAAQIREYGLLVACADPKAKIKGCWLHASSRSAWAVVHTMRKHKVKLDDVVVIEVTVPRGWLRRFQRGLWYTTQDIPATRLGGTRAGAEFGASASQ